MRLMIKQTIRILKKIMIYIGLILSAILLLFIIVYFILGAFGKDDVKIKPDKDSILFFAHRGDTLSAVENSFDSFSSAKENGFKAVETDIAKLKDGHFVLFHDKNCKRLLGIDKDITEMTLEEIKRSPLLLNDSVTSNFVLSFEEFIDSFCNDFIVYLDLKSKNIFQAEAICEVIKKRNRTNSFIIANSNVLMMAYLKIKYPEITTALENFDSGKEWIYYILPKKLKPDFLSSAFDRINDNHIEWLKNRSLLKYRIVFGVNSTNLHIAVRWGLKYIIIDNPRENWYSEYNKISNKKQ